MGKMPLYTMLQKARSAGGWTMVAQLEGDAAGSQLLLLEGRPVWQRGDSTVLLQHLTEPVSYTHLDVYKRQPLRPR